MSRTITPPTERIPIGTVTIADRVYEVAQHPEITRFLFDLFARVGNTAALSNTELEALAQALTDSGAVPLSNTEAQEATRGVEELRQAVASLRGDNDRLRGEVEELRSLLEGAPSFQPLESRVQQIEDRLQ